LGAPEFKNVESRKSGTSSACWIDPDFQPSTFDPLLIDQLSGATRKLLTPRFAVS
jgi:hypothetical protein